MFKVFINDLEEILKRCLLSSLSLQVIPNWGDQLICLRAGMPFRWPKEARGIEKLWGKFVGMVVGISVVCPDSSWAVLTGEQPTDPKKGFSPLLPPTASRCNSQKNIYIWIYDSNFSLISTKYSQNNLTGKYICRVYFFFIAGLS